MEPKQLCKICIVGDSKVGKTSLIRQYVWKEFGIAHYDIGAATAPIYVKHVSIGDSQNPISCRLILFDLPGYYTDIGEKYFEKPSCVVLVFDMTNPETLHSIRTWVNRFDDETVQNVPMILVGSKCDLETKVDVSDIEKAAQSIPFLEVSAKTGHNVDSVFEQLVRAAYERGTLREVKKKNND